MKRKNVLVMVSPMSVPRVEGIARFAREHDWNLMIQDRLGYHPIACNGEEIRRQRFARAKLLLETTKMPVAKIAAETGFCTASHLSNTFRAATGFSPRVWRSRI